MGDDAGRPGSSLRGQLIAVGLFVTLTAGLLAAYSRAFGPTEAHDPAATARKPLAGRTPLARVSQFQSDLRTRFALNERGLPTVSAVVYDEDADRLHIVLSLDHTLDTPAAARGAGLRRVVDVLDAFRLAGLRCRTLLITATAPVADRVGTESEGMVIRCQFSIDHLDGADWSRLTGDDVPALAEQFWLYPDLQPPPDPREGAQPPDRVEKGPALPS